MKSLIFIFNCIFIGLSAFAQLNSDQFLLIEPSAHGYSIEPKVHNPIEPKVHDNTEPSVQRKIASSKKKGARSEKITEKIEIQENKPIEINKAPPVKEESIDKINVDLFCGIGTLNSQSNMNYGEYSTENMDCGIRTQLNYSNDLALKVGYFSKFNMKISEVLPSEKKVNANKETLEVLLNLKSNSNSNLEYLFGYYYENLVFPIGSSGRVGQLVKSFGLGVQKEIIKNQDQALRINFFVAPLVSHNQSSGSSAISIGTPSNGQFYQLNLEGLQLNRKKEYFLINLGYKKMNLPAEIIQQSLSDLVLDFGYRFSY
jgi:hypothetical protein